jgi:hypothetical protein
MRVRNKVVVSALFTLVGVLLMGAALGPGEGGRSLGIMPEMVAPGGGPCTDFDSFKQIAFVEEFTQPFTEVTSATFVDGTTDAEWERSGITFTGIGALADVNIGNSSYESAGNMLLLPGSAGNTGYNLQFTSPESCILPAGGGTCHPFRVPITNMALLGAGGGHKFCWQTRVGVYIASSPFEFWDSSFAVGMNAIDTNVMVPSTGALTSTGGGGNWGAEGFLFHLSRAGTLSFNINRAGTVTSTGAVALKSLIDQNVLIGEGLMLDLGVKITQSDPASGDDGTAKAYYRIVHPTRTRAWTQLGSTISGTNVLPYSVDQKQYFTWEVIQSNSDAEPLPGFGLETFLSHLMAYYNREEYGEAY